MIDANILEAFANTDPDDLKELLTEDDSAVEQPPEPPKPTALDKIVPMLVKNADEVQACCDELDPTVLANVGAKLSRSDTRILKQGLDQLGRPLRKLFSEIGEISPDEAEELGMQLESEGIVDDGGRVGGWLYRVGQLLGGSGGSR